MKILVTGGAGFIGAAVIRLLLSQEKTEVVNLDKLTYAGNLEALSESLPHDGYVFEEVDICDSAEVERVFSEHQPDCVMHLAAESHVDRSIDGPGDFIQTNIIGTYVLLQAALLYYEVLDEARREKFRFLHVSTDEVYGDLGEGDLFTEDSRYDPSSPYSASKAAADHLVRAWGRTYKLPTLVTNCSNNYGPYQFPEKLIPFVIGNALAGNNIPIYGDGAQVRDWIYVEDHAEALLTVLEEGPIGETYNIGGSNEIKNLDMVLTICKILDEMDISKPFGIRSFSELIEFVYDRPGHDQRYAIDSTKIQNLLGWSPKVNFETGLKNTVTWCVSNTIGAVKS